MLTDTLLEFNYSCYQIVNALFRRYDKALCNMKDDTNKYDVKVIIFQFLII